MFINRATINLRCYLITVNVFIQIPGTLFRINLLFVFSEVADISIQSRTSIGTAEPGISGSSRQELLFPSSSGRRADELDTISLFSECFSEEENFGDSLLPSDIEMNDDELCEPTSSINYAGALEEESK